MSAISALIGASAHRMLLLYAYLYHTNTLCATSTQLGVARLRNSDSWALMRSSGAVRGVEGALDGFWGDDQGICGLESMARVWVHVWLRHTPYSGRVAVLNSRISAGKRNSGAIRRVQGAAGGSWRGKSGNLRPWDGTEHVEVCVTAICSSPWPYCGAKVA